MTSLPAFQLCKAVLTGSVRWSRSPDGAKRNSRISLRSMQATLWRRVKRAHQGVSIVSADRGERTWCMRGKDGAQNRYDAIQAPAVVSALEGISDKICSS